MKSDTIFAGICFILISLILGLGLLWGFFEFLLIPMFTVVG
jgi:hypothetical protein